MIDSIATGTQPCPAVTTAQDLRRIDARDLIGRPEAVARDRAARGGCERRVTGARCSAARTIAPIG